jgi:hypothetical protein
MTRRTAIQTDTMGPRGATTLAGRETGPRTRRGARPALARIAAAGTALLAVVALVRCGGSPSGGVAGTAAPVVSATAPPTAAIATAVPALATPGLVPTSTAIPALNRPLEGPLPRPVRYGGLQFSVVKGAITNQSPDGQLDPSHAYAYLDLTVQNPQGASSLIAPGLARLQLADGKAYADGSQASVAVPAQASAELQAVFPVPVDATWADAQLVLGRPEKEPAVLPLTGPVPTSPYPLQLAATGEATAKSYTYKLTGATVDLDDKLQRVDQGKRFLRLTLQVARNGDSNDWGGKTVMAENFRLLVDGQPLAPLDAPNELINLNSSVPAEVVFVVPATASHVDLQVNEDGDSGTAKTIPVNLQIGSTSR